MRMRAVVKHRVLPSTTPPSDVFVPAAFLRQAPANIAQFKIDVHGLQSYEWLINAWAPALIGASAIPILQCQRSDRIVAGYGGDVARFRIEAGGRPTLRDGSIAIPCCEPQLAGPIAFKLQAAKVSRQTDAQSFDDCLLVRPQHKERIPLGRFRQGSQGSAFRQREIALHDVHGLRQIAQLLDIHADGVVALHCEYAAVAAVRDAELEIGTGRLLDQIRLPMTVTCEAQCRAVCPAIVGEDASHDAMRLNETNPVVLECELRSPRALLSGQQPQRVGNCVVVVAEAGSPHMNFAARQARTICVGVGHSCDLAPGADMPKVACTSWTNSLARASAAVEM